ncbi:hypothetical protein ACFXPA_27540 [Amycolatopsis sp. NPDC059090]
MLDKELVEATRRYIRRAGLDAEQASQIWQWLDGLNTRLRELWDTQPKR